MKKKTPLQRYIPAIVSLAALGALSLIMPEIAPRAGKAFVDQLTSIALVVPPIFMLLGLLDVWVPRDTMIRFMGPDSGIRGPVLAFLLGSAAAGPLYGAFPVAGVLMKKGASFHNILIFIGAWSTTKVPMFLFEMQALGKRFALSRLAIDLVGITVIAFAIEIAVPKKEVERIYALAAEEEN
ncbi:permease [Treponema zuelzerae]|uniref:Permease n=1 Tax=Teretinema zuelzerae TaxID=156 RepID=A0AAE3EH77_9SPIR|nr:permease [Teretinema zuelzerae]MCD1653793.1 permease [Teretinema zuelzerae]